MIGAVALSAGSSLGRVTPSVAAGAPSFARVCAAPVPGNAGCMAIRVEGRTQAGGSGTTPSGYGPADLQSAYDLASASASLGAGKIVAVIDAYDDPTALSDLCTYRAAYNLPPLRSGCPNSTGTGPLFVKMNQNGGTTSFPKSDSGWSQEISLDLDMVSAICPNCHILLIEANSSSLSNLGTAVNQAARWHVAAISNSYGGSESSSDTTADTSYYKHPGIAITASSGDSGYGPQYPAASPYVTAVGGTTLQHTGSTWTEAAWTCNGNFSCLLLGGTGSGCSAYEFKAPWQTDTGCARRTIADVSADADPNTGVAVYYKGSWGVYGGTSVASPIIASIYALAGNYNATTNPYPTSLLYAHASNLNDITTSDANVSCNPTYLCNAGTGFDGPTGLGTPNGTGAF